MDGALWGRVEFVEPHLLSEALHFMAGLLIAHLEGRVNSLAHACRAEGLCAAESLGATDLASQE